MQTKIIIIGAGPAGLSAAIELKNKGDFDVTILERKPGIDYKICAGGIEYDFLKRYLSESIIEKNFYTLRFTTPGDSICIKKDFVMISTVNRRTLHEYLAQKAINSGVKIIFDQNLKDISNNTAITHSGNAYKFDYLIGADGSNSAVRKKLKLDSKRIIAAFQYIVKCDYPDMEFFVDLEKFGYSYAWIFPYKDTVSVGAGFYPGDSKNFSMKDLQNNLKKWAENKFDLSNSKFEAFSINYDYQGFEFGNIYLAGDAAGFASGLTGEGIKFAILSGIDVAQKIADPDYECVEIKKMLKTKKASETFREYMKINPIIGKIMLKSFSLSLKNELGQRLIARIS
ncbi:MAG: NAD(P)/FAD-dependent oxidoreductase [Candidatus Paceibacterota bacterium]|jgi:geranylgeranyl reductase